MIHIEQITNNNALLNHLHIFDKNLSCKIFPNLGASLQEFIFKTIVIIDGISIDEHGISDYATTYKSSILFPFPNRIKDGIYEFNKKEYHLTINEVQLNNAIHGLVFDKAFTVNRTIAEKERAIIELSFESNGELKGFPFKFRLNLTYIIDINGGITLHFKVINLDDRTFPFGLGWHPYFKSNALKNSQISFSSKDHYNCSKRNIPVGIEKSKLPHSFTLDQQSFDDTYSLNQATAKFEDKDYKLNLSFENNLDPYLQIYTPLHRKSIAIEPMTCTADTFNNKHGLQLLSPKKSFVWKVKFDVKTKNGVYGL